MATVAVVNSNEDTVEMLRIRLEGAGFNTVAGDVTDFKRGRADFQEFLATHQPRVVVYDVAPPYEENWTFFNQIRATPAGSRLRFILTTTNRQVMEKYCGGSQAYEIIGKPYDLDAVVQAVRQAVPPS
jgi:CheY-like chemotaxis protein